MGWPPAGSPGTAAWPDGAESADAGGPAPRRGRRRTTRVHGAPSPSRASTGAAGAAGTAGRARGETGGGPTAAGAGGARRRIWAHEAKGGSGEAARAERAGEEPVAVDFDPGAPRGGLGAAGPPAPGGTAGRGRPATTAASAGDGTAQAAAAAWARPGARGDEGATRIGGDEADGDDGQDRPTAGEPYRNSGLRPAKAARPLARTTSTADSNSKQGSSTGNPATNALTAKMTAPAKADAASPPPIADDIAPPEPGGGGREGIPTSRTKRSDKKRTARTASARGPVGMRNCWGDAPHSLPPTPPACRVGEARRTRGLDFYGHILLWPPNSAHGPPVHAAR